MGTLSKALGSSGGFICGSSALIDYLLGAARSFLFTTALPPASAAAALAALTIVRRDPDRITKLTANGARLRRALIDLGLNVPAGFTPIIPVFVGDVHLATRIANELDPAYQVPAIRPPTVPDGTSRLRISASSSLDIAVIDAFVAQLHAACVRQGLLA
jgi:7-keto-8-aminopelargonate synthetase-like enzyme